MSKNPTELRRIQRKGNIVEILSYMQYSLLKKDMKNAFNNWIEKTFTKENARKFFVTQLTDILLAILFFLAIANIVPFGVFLAAAIICFSVFLAKKIHQLIDKVKETMKTHK